jgi:hypothetical protein
MDFIERIFHVAPDGGNGMTELAIVAVVIFVSAAVYWLRRRRATNQTLSQLMFEKQTRASEGQVQG